MSEETAKPFNKEERFVCTMLCGGVPIDVSWYRETGIFKNGMVRFQAGEWKEIWEDEIKKQKQKQ